MRFDGPDKRVQAEKGKWADGKSKERELGGTCEMMEREGVLIRIRVGHKEGQMWANSPPCILFLVLPAEQPHQSLR